MAKDQVHAQVAGDGIDVVGIGKFISQVFKVLEIQIQCIGSELMAMFKSIGYLINVAEHDGILIGPVGNSLRTFCTKM